VKKLAEGGEETEKKEAARGERANGKEGRADPSLLTKTGTKTTEKKKNS